MALVDLLLGTRPAALWPLHEASGTFRDRSGNGRDSSSLSSPVYQANAVAPADYLGVRLSGTQFVEFPAATADFGSGQALSFGGWFRLNATGAGAQWFFGKANSTTVGTSIYVAADGSITLYCQNGGNDEYFYTATGILTTAMQRRHIIVTLGTDNVARIYVDAQLQTCTYTIGPGYSNVTGLTSKVMTQRTNTGALRLGKGALGAAPDMTYGMCGVWQAELNAQQVAQHYQWGLGYQPSLLGRRRLRAGWR